jgi:hypothetical protein
MRKVWAALVMAIAMVVLPLAMPASADDGPVTLKSLGEGDRDVRGMYGATSFFVPIPPGAAVSGPVQVDVDFSHSPLLVPELSTMTLRVNDVSLGSAFLTPANRSHGHLVVDVPTEIIGTDGIFVEARFYMRLTRDACEEPTNPALWATVHGATVITMPTAFAGPRDVSDIPDLVVPARPTDRPLTIVVPDNPNDTVLRATGVVAATSGSWLGAAGRDAVVATAPTAAPDAPAIEVGVLLDVPGVDVRGATHGVIAVSQDGPVRVTVTGPTAAAVLRAARSLALVDRLHGPAVSLTGSRLAPDPKRTPPWTASAASFTQLGIDRLDVSGPGTKQFDLVVERPAGWHLTRTGHVDLDIDTAPGVRRGPSFVEVHANGFDLGTRRLVPGGGTHRYGFAVPGGLIDRDVRGRPVRALRLQVRVHLMPEQRTCSPLDAEATKASIATTSKVTLPHKDAGRLDVGRFPSSLGDPVVLIDGNGQGAVALGVQAAASVGRWANAAAVQVMPVSSLTASERKGANLLVVSDAEAVDRQLVLDAKPAAAVSGSVVAFAGLKASPFDSGRTALVVAGEDAGKMAALRALGSLAGVEKVAGNVVAVVSNSPRAQTLVAETGAAPPVELAPTLTKSRIRSETIIGAVLLAAFLVSIVLVIRFRWRSPRS